MADATSQDVGRSGARRLAALTIALGLLTAPFLLAAVARIPYVVPIEPNEGWNALHTARLHAGGPLYVPVGGLPLSPVNYPPLSFLVFSGLSFLFGDLLVLGRVVSGACFLAIAGLVYLTVRALAPERRWPAVLGAAVWVSVGGHTAYRYLAMYEPQMLGHVFTTAALWLYARWRARLSPGRIAVLALLCCLGLGVKHLLIAAPVALALVMARHRWRDFFTFAGSGIGIAAVLGVLAWWRFGPDLVSNILGVELARGKDVLGGLYATWEQVVAPGSLLLLVPALALSRERRREWDVAFVYLAVSLVEASLAVLGDGVDVNAWFDLLIGACIVAGLLAADLLREPVPTRPRRAAWACLAVVLVPAVLGFPSRVGALVDDARALPEKERMLRGYVARLREAPQGPVLYEDRLMGYLAGRPALFDRFTGAMLLRSGRVPEQALVEPLRAGAFGVIVLERDVRERLALLHGQTAEPGRVTYADNLAWTDNVLRALDAAYEYVPTDGPYHVYQPRRARTDAQDSDSPRRL